MTRMKPMARICWLDVSIVCLRIFIVVKRTKDKTMIVLTPAMIAIGCAEVVGSVDSR